MTDTGNKSSRCARLHPLNACLVVLACYLWLIVLAAGGTAGAHFLGWSLEAFRIDAVYEILSVHVCAALFVTVLIYATRNMGRAPAPAGKSSPAGKIALAASPLILGISCDRLALLTYPPVRLDPSAALFQSHPTRSWALRPNAEAPALHVKLNERGTRGPVIPFDKSPGERRVLILGDSVAFGGGVAYNGCFDRLAVERLRRDGFENVAIVNLSVPGYSPWQHVDILQREGMAYDPDVVVYAFCMNDVVDWLWRGVPGRHPSPYCFDDLEVSGLFRLARGLWQEWRHWSVARSVGGERDALVSAMQDADTPEVREAWRILLEQVGRIVALAREHDRRAAFLVFPTSGQVRCDAGEIVNPQRRLVAYAEANGVPCLELLTSFLEYCDAAGRDSRGRDSRELFTDGWHLSPAGHEATAVAFAEFLENEHLIEK